MTEEEFLKEIFRLYVPQLPAGPTEYRVYHQYGKIVCFSEEKLDMPYVVVDEATYKTYRPDLFEIKEGKLVKKDFNYQNKLRLRKSGNQFVTVKDDMQFAVDKDADLAKDFWEINNASD
jgi:hypothetical protein